MSLQRTRQTVAVLMAMFVMLCGQATAWTDPAVDKILSSDTFSLIRQRYEGINAKAAKYRQVKKELAGFSTEGGEFTAYFNGDTLAKIELTYYGESGQATEEYYYWDGQLIFIYRTDSSYGRLRSGQPSGKIAQTEKSRFYFRDNKLILWLEKNDRCVIAKSELERYEAKQQECLQNSREFSAAARSPGKTIEATR